MKIKFANWLTVKYLDDRSSLIIVSYYALCNVNNHLNLEMKSNNEAYARQTRGTCNILQRKTRTERRRMMRKFIRKIQYSTVERISIIFSFTMTYILVEHSKLVNPVAPVKIDRLAPLVAVNIVVASESRMVHQNCVTIAIGF